MPALWPRILNGSPRGHVIVFLIRLLFPLFALSAALPAAGDTNSSPLAPGYGDLGFKAPEAGSYALPDLGPAADARLLNSNGQRITLHEAMKDKITLLSFIYSSCHDANGCPLATHVLERTRKALEKDPDLSSRLRILTISFDPKRDTPKVMAAYGKPFLKEGFDWLFLTPESTQALKSLLKGYQQTVSPEVTEVGTLTGDLSHILRVMLVDSNFIIRNSYTPSTLHPDLLLSDLRTLVMGPSQARISLTKQAAPHLRGGDDKTGYERKDYKTESAALTQRRGTPQDLIGLVAKNAQGLPDDPSGYRSPLSPQKIALGRKLFFDRRLSLNGTFSCAMCHIPEQGFTSQEQSTAIGIEGRTVRRNAPTIFNTGRLKRFFHDGREDRLENQVWGPFLAANEMGNPSVGEVLRKIRQSPDYAGLFETAFKKEPTMDTVGEALAQYERTLTAGNSPFDEWLYAHQKDALTPKAQEGYRLFTGKAGCSACHTLDKSSALLTDEGFHNTGVGYQDSMAPDSSETKVQIAPGVWTTMDAASLARVSEKRPSDLGLYEITQNPDDRWKYRTPGLRNVALTGPYMHNGSLKTLTEVIQFYQKGGIANPLLDTRIKPLSLTPAEIKALVAFLESLTGQGVDSLIEDAWAAPIGDPSL